MSALTFDLVRRIAGRCGMEEGARESSRADAGCSPSSRVRHAEFTRSSSGRRHSVALGSGAPIRISGTFFMPDALLSLKGI